MPDSSMDDNSSKAICLGDVVEFDSEPMTISDSIERICIVMNGDSILCRSVKKTPEGYVLSTLNKDLGEQLIRNAEGVKLYKVKSYIRAY